MRLVPLGHHKTRCTVVAKGFTWSLLHDLSFMSPELQPGSLWQLTPVKAVPAKAQARGSMYQGLMLMRYRLTATETRVMPTALQAFRGLTSNTCRAGSAWHKPL